MHEADGERLGTGQSLVSATTDHRHKSQTDPPQSFGLQPLKPGHERLQAQHHSPTTAAHALREAIKRPGERSGTWSSDGALDRGSTANTVTPPTALEHVPLTPVTISDYGTAVDRTSVDAMGAVSNCETNEVSQRCDPGLSFFGSSSVVDFMSKVQRTISGSTLLSRSGSSAQQRSRFPGSQGPESRLKSQDEHARATGPMSDPIHEAYDYIVPARSEADSFVNSYFTNINSIHPTLHRPTFVQQYDKLWSPDGFGQHARHPLSLDELWRRENEKTTVYLICNLVMALGCRSDPSLSAADRISKSERIFLRTQQSRMNEILDHNTMESVQILLLMGRYLQTTNKSAKCWNVVGLAIRVAQSLGLHLDVGRGSQYSQLDIEMRRRVWCACLLLDR